MATDAQESQPVVEQCTICHCELTWRDKGKTHCRNCRNRLVDLQIRKGVPATEMRPVTVIDPETKEERVEVRKVRRLPGPPKAIPGSLLVSKLTARPRHMRSVASDDPRRSEKPVRHHVVSAEVKKVVNQVYHPHLPPSLLKSARDKHKTNSCVQARPHTQVQMPLSHRALHRIVLAVLDREARTEAKTAAKLRSLKRPTPALRSRSQKVA